MRKLSEIEQPERLAFCTRCKETFVDDMSLIYGSIYCPNGCEGLLERQPRSGKWSEAEWLQKVVNRYDAGILKPQQSSTDSSP